MAVRQGATWYESRQRHERVLKEHRNRRRIANQPKVMLSLEEGVVKSVGNDLIPVNLTFRSIRSIQLEANEKDPCKLTVVFLTQEGERECAEFALNGSDDARIVRRIARITGMTHNIEGNRAYYAEPRGRLDVDDEIFKLKKVTHNQKTALTTFEYSGKKIRKLHISTPLVALLFWIYLHRMRYQKCKRKLEITQKTTGSNVLHCYVRYYS